MGGGGRGAGGRRFLRSGPALACRGPAQNFLGFWAAARPGRFLSWAVGRPRASWGVGRSRAGLRPTRSHKNIKNNIFWPYFHKKIGSKIFNFNVVIIFGLKWTFISIFGQRYKFKKKFFVKNLIFQEILVPWDGLGRSWQIAAPPNFFINNPVFLLGQPALIKWCSCMPLPYVGKGRWLSPYYVVLAEKLKTTSYFVYIWTHFLNFANLCLPPPPEIFYWSRHCF